jgi:integrase
LVDAPDLGSGWETSAGSSPVSGTTVAGGYEGETGRGRVERGPKGDFFRDAAVTRWQGLGVKIRPRKYASGKVVWQVDLGEIEGKRVQRSYPTEAKAKKAVEAAENAHARHGALASSMTGKEMAEIVLARERLLVTGATISQAVDFYLSHARTMTKPKLLAELVEAFRDAKDEAGCSARYYRQLGVSLGSLAKHMPGAMAHEITREDVDGWLRSGTWSGRTRNGYAGDVRAMFAWALKEGHAKLNPALEIDRMKTAEGEIGTLSVAQCKELLIAAVKKPDVMGFVALGIFGGLRPAEIARLDWSAVDMEAGTVIVAGSQAKTRRRRVVDLCPNAVAWIKASKVSRKGAICGKWWDARWRLFRHSLGWAVGMGEKRVKRAVVKPVHGGWPHNALRHTYASMHYAHFENEAALQVQMGHESAAMLHRHYRALKTRAEAAKFWALRP